MLLARLRQAASTPMAAVLSAPFRRGFADNTKFRPAVNAAKRTREKMGVQPAPLETPSKAAPREGPGTLVQGFGGVGGGYASGRGLPNARSGGPKGGRQRRVMNNHDLLKPTTLAESTELFSKIVHVGRVSRMTGQGRKQQFRALVIMGNGKGVAGFGVGKGLNAKSALTSAMREGEKDLVFVDVSPWGSLYHDVRGKCNNTQVVIKGIEFGRWYRSGGTLIKSIMECVGISNYSTYMFGRRNPFSIVNAVFDALGKHETPKEVAKRRQRRLYDKANPDYWQNEKMH